MALTKRQKEILAVFKAGGKCVIVTDHSNQKVYYVLSLSGKPNVTVQSRTIDGLYHEGVIKFDEGGYYVLRH